MSEWRQRVLDRLDTVRGKLHVSVGTEKLARMYEIAEARGAQETEEKQESAPQARAVKLLSASSSYVQAVKTSEVPYHYQIVVPGATGTAHANPQQLYEVSIWERCLLQIFWGAGVNCTRFESCNCRAPLLIDVFPTPEIEAAELYWKAAFADLGDSEETKVIQLQSRSLKQMFPPATQYAAVVFDDGKGMATVCNGASNLHAIAVDVVAGLWRDTKQDPPENLDSMVVNYPDWPT